MFDEDLKNIEAKVIRGVNNAVKIVKKDVDSKTPEDTKTLLGNNKIIPAQRNGDIVIASVQNTTEYAEYVEYGVGGRRFNYHKPKGSVAYTGVGARMYTRASDDSANAVRKAIDEALS